MRTYNGPSCPGVGLEKGTKGQYCATSLFYRRMGSGLCATLQANVIICYRMGSGRWQVAVRPVDAAFH